MTCDSDSDACLTKLKASGMFGQLAGTVGVGKSGNVALNATGILEYVWKKADGTYAHRQSPFTADLLLGLLGSSGECEGGETEAIDVKPVELKLDNSSYKLPLVFQRTIAPGRTGRYELALQAPKSSQHKFRIEVQLSDGREFASRPVNLLYFTPNWGSHASPRRRGNS